jgi:hypothetical protein
MIAPRKSPRGRGSERFPGELAQGEEVIGLDELVKLVSQKTGLSQEMAKKAVETVIGYLKKELPDPIASQIDSVLGGGGMPKDLGGWPRAWVAFWARSNPFTINYLKGGNDGNLNQ